MIETVEAAHRELPLVETQWKGAGEVKGVQDAVFVRIVAEDGVTGYGEASSWPVFSGQNAAAVMSVINGLLAPAVTGLDERDREGVRRRMDAELPGNNLAKAAVDMAVHDLVARRAGVPVCGLLGGDHRFRAGLSYSLSMRDPAEVSAQAESKARKGYRTFKLKLGTFGASADRERLRALRATAPGALIRVDYNRRAREPELRELLDVFHDTGVDFCEQPFGTDQLTRVERLRTWFDVPIALDESITGPSALDEVVRRGLCDVVCLKLGIAGGLRVLGDMARTAIEHGVGVYCGALNETQLGMAATMHAMSAAGPIVAGSDCYVPYEVLGATGVTGGPVFRDGEVGLGDVPGLGVDLPEDWFPATAAGLDVGASA